MSSPSPTLEAGPWSAIDPASFDVRLVVCDMDGTLLTATGELPEGFAGMRETMRARGVTFVPASGRQHATLARMFPEETTFIPENGSLVVHDGVVVATTCLDPAVALDVISRARAAREADVGLVLCGDRGAYIERTDAAFVAEVEKYYTRLEGVEDLTAVRDAFLKVAVFDFVDARRAASTFLAEVSGDHLTVVSGHHWVDVMNPEATKGAGLRELQDVLGVTREQTVVFGDYLNDLEMLDEADLSFAMANGHPRVIERARFLAPSNSENGVLAVLEHLLA